MWSCRQSKLQAAVIMLALSAALAVAGTEEGHAKQQNTSLINADWHHDIYAGSICEMCDTPE
eukprot:scaffold14356_cov38-Prasinocladus_malaysianus.AAC.1